MYGVLFFFDWGKGWGCYACVFFFFFTRERGGVTMCMFFFTGERGRAARCMVVGSMVRNSNIANGS